MDNEKIIELLTEIRDARRAADAEYLRIAAESLNIQKQAFALQQQAVAKQEKALAEQARAVAMQANFGRLYRVALAVVALLIGFLLFKLWRHL